uniref:Zinc finger protein 2 n=1 Tax=Ceratitis capitata TaxID=7213 RepID=W8CAC7_CERCA
MEISIKWNICRICLAEEGQNHGAKYIIIDSKTAKQINDIAGIQMERSDNLPDKICRKCLLLLKYSCHFRTTCRNSDEYLQSIIQKTKSATSMLKMEKQRHRSVDLLEESFNADEEYICPNDIYDEQCDSNVEVPFNKKRKQLTITPPETIGDSDFNNTSFVQNDTIKVLKKQDHKKDSLGESINYMITMDKEKKIGNSSGPTTSTISGKIQAEKESLNQKGEDEENQMEEFYENKQVNYISKGKYIQIRKDEKCSDHEYLDEDYEENKFIDFGRDIRNSTIESERKIVVYGFEETKPDSQGMIEIQNENSSASENLGRDPLLKNNTEEMKTALRLPSPRVETEPEADEELYYLIDEPDIKTDESPNNQLQQVEPDPEDDAHDESTMNLIDDLTETEETAYDNCDTPISVAPIEEYLIDDNDIEPASRHELVLLEDQRPSSTTIRIKGRATPRKKSSDSYMYSCDVCGNHFTSRSLRNYHMRIHRKEKNFECELCFKRFTAACNLTAHMRIHTGEKPYQCKYCLRRFTDRSTHVKHERVHTNEKPFPCSTCGKAFALSTTLRTHEKVHTNEKPFKCEPCDKSFKLPHQLKSHLLTNQHKNILEANEIGNNI